jgi:hypothetical protein
MGSSSNLGGGNAHSRLYQKGAEQLEKAAKKRDEVWNEQDTFTPDISASQKYCEAESLPGARHAALFMQVCSKGGSKDDDIGVYIRFV